MDSLLVCYMGIFVAGTVQVTCGSTKNEWHPEEFLSHDEHMPKTMIVPNLVVRFLSCYNFVTVFSATDSRELRAPRNDIMIEYHEESSPHPF